MVPATTEPRVFAIVIASLVGFLAGELLAAIFEAGAAALAGFPGGLSALAKVADPPWWANTVGLLGLWIGMGGAILFAYRDGRLTRRPGQWRPHASDLLFVLVGVVAQFVVDVLYAPFHLSHLDRPIHHLFSGTSGAGFLTLALLTTLVAPFFEEWLFRGVLFRTFAEGATRFGATAQLVVAMVASALLFALAHAEPEQFVGLALLGVLLAYIYHHMKRLVPCYVTHASFNAVALVALVAQRAGH